MSPMGDWPLLRHIPDVITIELGGHSHPTRTRVLELLNVTGIGGGLLAARVALVRVAQAAWFWGFALVLLSSPLLWYTRTTLGEALASELWTLARRLLASPVRLGAVFVAALVFTLPNIGQTWRPNAIGGFFRQENCDAPWRSGTAKFNACQHREMWLDRPMPLYALHGVNTQAGLAMSVVVALGLAGCLLLLRAGLGTEQCARAEEDERRCYG